MDQQAAQAASAARARSPSAGNQQAHIRNSHSPSPQPYQAQPDSNIGLGLGFDPTANNPQPQQFNTSGDFGGFNTSQAQVFPQQGITDAGFFEAAQTQAGASQNLLASDFNGNDFSLFPPTTQADQFTTPLFGDITQTNNTGMNTTDLGNMASAQTHTSPTPPHMLQPEPHQPGSAQHSPAFNQHQFSSSPARHSRNTSLTPEAALMSSEWSGQQFQGHRRTPSEYSDVSSAAPSPHLVSQDNFESGIEYHHSPMQRPQEFTEGVAGLGNFSISDPQMAARSRSPSHSPAISPRILPQQAPDMSQPGFSLGGQPAGYMSAPTIGYPQQAEQFPSFAHDSMMPTPSINIDLVAPQSSYDGPKQPLDQASLTPPDRGRAQSRRRAVTDSDMSRPTTPGGLSPHLGADLANRSASESSRSLSPGDRAGSANAQSRRRQSMSAVPQNVMALRLADPEYQAAQDSGNAKRAQKHPATFQCTLCPKRFTRAYNLRSHLRTHTDERPFVCTVCGKAFARQHDRKRHEGLHSGEKKFVCKGDLKAGGQWGCGRRFARADALGRHFRSEAGRICIKPLLDEELLERQRIWNEQRMQSMAQNMAAQQVMMDPNVYPGMDPNNQYALPQAILAQYPSLAGMTWNPNDMGNIDEDLSGRSSFDASDYEEGEDTGYVSGPGTGFGEGGMGQNFGDVGYASDYGGR